MLELEGCHRFTQHRSRTSLTSWLQRVPILLSQLGPRGSLRTCPHPLEVSEQERDAGSGRGGVTLNKVRSAHLTLSPTHSTPTHFPPGQLLTWTAESACALDAPLGPITSCPFSLLLSKPLTCHPSSGDRAFSHSSHPHSSAEASDSKKKWFSPEDLPYVCLSVCLSFSLVAQILPGSVLSADCEDWDPGNGLPPPPTPVCWSWRRGTSTTHHPPNPIYTPLASGWSLLSGQRHPGLSSFISASQGRHSGKSSLAKQSTLPLGGISCPALCPLPESLVFLMFRHKSCATS